MTQLCARCFVSSPWTFARFSLERSQGQLVPHHQRCPVEVGRGFQCMLPDDIYYIAPTRQIQYSRLAASCQ